MNVLVVGDVMLDRYWHGATRRVSPEAPVPVVEVEHTEDCPGGAAMVALNVSSPGAGSTRLECVDHDAPGRPANNLDRRLRVLAGLESVDWVVPFDEDTPDALGPLQGHEARDAGAALGSCHGLPLPPSPD